MTPISPMASLTHVIQRSWPPMTEDRTFALFMAWETDLTADQCAQWLVEHRNATVAAYVDTLPFAAAMEAIEVLALLNTVDTLAYIAEAM